MATSIRLRGGTTSQHSSFTGAAKEVTVDTDKNTIVVHDGSTAGGHPLTTSLSDLGVTASAAEINHVNGVTSAIQTQLNAKVGATYTGNIDVTGELIVDSYNETYAALSGTSPAVNCHNGNSFSLVLSGATTFTFTNPPSSGTAYTFSVEIIQDSGASGHTVTWPSSVDWPAATAPTLTATASAKDIFVFTTRDGGTNWYGFTAGQALA